MLHCHNVPEKAAFNLFLTEQVIIESLVSSWLLLSKALLVGLKTNSLVHYFLEDFAKSMRKHGSRTLNFLKMTLFKADGISNVYHWWWGVFWTAHSQGAAGAWPSHCNIGH